jgi:SAM-dependent methyltransferase
MLNLKPTDSVLDLGCGEGLLAYKFKHYCAKLTGLDLSKDALKIASQINPECEFLYGDICKTNLPKKSFDIVYCFEVLQYIKHKSPVFNEMINLARRSVIFSVPNYDCLWAQLTKARQALFGVQDYPDSPPSQWFRLDRSFTLLNVKCKYHSLASRVQTGLPGLLKYYLRILLRFRLFIIVRIDLKGPE